MKSTGLRAAVCAAIAASILACAEKKETAREERVPVTVAVAEQRDIPVQVRAIGSVQPISAVAVRALVAGQLQRVWFREGEDVHKDDVQDGKLSVRIVRLFDEEAIVDLPRETLISGNRVRIPR